MPHLRRIWFSKFCELWPKFHVTVGSNGSQSVCVCTIHQNTKLQMAGLRELHDYNYTILMSKIVCNSSRPCILHRWKVLRAQEELDTDEAVDHEEPVTFKQWVHMDRTTLVTQEEPFSDHTDHLCDKVYDLIFHDFIAKSQSSFLRYQKDNPIEGTCIF